MDFEVIRKRLDALIAAGKKGEIRGALSMLNEVDIAGYIDELENDKVLMCSACCPRTSLQMSSHTWIPNVRPG